MQAPNLNGVQYVFYAGLLLLGALWLLAPAMVAFIAAYIVLDLSIATSKLAALCVLALWIACQLAYALYAFIHSEITKSVNRRKHMDFMRLRDIFYYRTAACAESYESLKERERKWLNGEKPGSNVPDSPLRCDCELRDEVGSWLSSPRDV